MRDVPVINPPTWPALHRATTPARMSFKMTFEATDTAVLYGDEAKRLRVKD